MTTAVSPIRVAHTIPSRFIFIRMSSVEMGQPPAAKDTLLVAGGQYASLSFFAPSPRSFVEESWHTGNILKKAHSHIEESSTLFSDGVPPHPPRVPARPGCRARCASGRH